MTLRSLWSRVSGVCRRDLRSSSANSATMNGYIADLCLQVTITPHTSLLTSHSSHITPHITHHSSLFTLHSQCRQCFCRPMWCLSCMSKWYSSRQDRHRIDTWMSGTAPCPMCRAPFCMLDIQSLEPDGENS